MKRFFIFAAMLLSMTVNAGNLQDDPPLITPSPEQIVLIPQDMFDIDRSIAICEYTYSILGGKVYINCIGTGNRTELYLTDQNGTLLDMTEINSATTQDAMLEADLSAGTYRIVLNSEKYYGEAYFTIY